MRPENNKKTDKLMITNIHGALYVSSSYDILNDENNRKKFEKQKTIAADYIRRNPKPNFYCITGRDLREEMELTDSELSCLLPFSDEEVARIKELLVQTYNEDSDVCKTFEEICEDMEIEELESINAELDVLAKLAQMPVTLWDEESRSRVF